MGEKKRKRREDGEGRPSKKAAVTKSLGTVRVEHVKNESVVQPVLAATPGLKPSSKITFKAYKTKTQIRPDGVHYNLILQSSDHPRLDYLAREERDGSSNSLLKDYIGVFDPATNALQLVEVKRVTVRTALRSEAEEVQEESTPHTTHFAKRNALAEQFGSRRSQKALLEMRQNAISRGEADNPDAVKDDLVSQAVLQDMDERTSSMPTKKELEATADSEKPRPKPNRNAEIPADVYPIDVVIGRELMALIPVKDWVDASEKGQGVSVSSKYVAKRVVKLCKNNEIQKLKVLKFIMLCANFYDALKPNGMKPRKVPPSDKLQTAMGEDAPGAVIASIRRAFTSENNDLTRWHVDYLMTHIMASALIVDNFELDVYDLCNDLKLETKEIRQYFRELGCKVTKISETERAKKGYTKNAATSHWIAKLKLPLDFPTVKAGRAKKR